VASKAQKKESNLTGDVAAAARRSACGRAPTLAMDAGELGRVRVGDFWQGTSAQRFGGQAMGLLLRLGACRQEQFGSKVRY
jgi:hypothetical protein